jgi:hypothetical protein
VSHALRPYLTTSSDAGTQTAHARSLSATSPPPAAAAPAPPPPDFPESDFNSEQAVRAKFAPEDFTFKYEKAIADFPGGSAKPMLITTDPYLGSLPGDGIGQTVVMLHPCGVNQLHVHPRGTETVFMLQGALRRVRAALPPRRAPLHPCIYLRWLLLLRHTPRNVASLRP